MTQEDDIFIRYPSTVYSSTAILKATEKYLHLAYFELTTDAKDEPTITLRVKLKEENKCDKDTFKMILENEVIEQMVRLEVARETRNTRDLIMAYAFQRVELE